MSAGILFALFWASAATATKFALQSAQPLVIAQIRFAVAGIIMILGAHFIFRQSMPSRKIFGQIIIYGLLNITIYLGCYVTAMKHVTAGIGALAIAINPIYIAFLSILFLKKKLSLKIITAILLGTFGVIFASLPLMEIASVTTGGLLLLLFGMLSYSVGAIYFSQRSWGNASLLTINGWQTFLGGLMLFPLTIYNFDEKQNQFDPQFWYSTLWLALAVSIIAVSLWLWLLSRNAVKTGIWLFLCPLFGLLIAYVLLDEPIDYHTFAGLAAVIAALMLGERTPANSNAS
ncbi:MAG: DMT family transporter [Chitinophagales bacterium]|nr:DMT family transporter [Chitinophagales bacterium]